MRYRNVVPWAVVLAACALAPTAARAAVRYVDANSANPIAPYTNWAGAARIIQDAVDAAAPGDEVIVTNGTYATGGRVMGTSQLVNRVAVDKGLTVRSVNGPQFTIIQGYQVPGTTNDDSAIRCVYLTSGAMLSGFTLTNGATRRDGDYYGEQSGGGVWCESSAVVSKCVVVGNSAEMGGGGMFDGTAIDCTLNRNWSRYVGGAAYQGTLSNCMVTGNSARYGGGACASTLHRCALTINSASYGGAALNCTLNNCALTQNSASGGGGGASGGTLNNCTLTGNSASRPVNRGEGMVEGGGAMGATLNDCIIYFNTAPFGANYIGGSLNYCCTTPLPETGSGNIDVDPQLAGASRLSANSPCRGVGSTDYAAGTDIDGEPWGCPPSIGCDEYRPEAVTGPLRVVITPAFTNVPVGYSVGLKALIDGRASMSVWDFGDARVLTNRPYAEHSWTAAGDYAVVLRAYNLSNPEGVSATIMVHVVAQPPVYYVAAGNLNPVPPYATWATAATNIQDAIKEVDDSFPSCSVLVLVTNGTYSTGGRAIGRAVNRVVVDKPLRLRSVNGPQFTIIQGAKAPGGGNGEGAIRCVYLADGASLSGFTLTNGATPSAAEADYDRELTGGGVWCESSAAVASNCVIAGNSAAGSAGGAFGGTLNHCKLTANSAENGGGADRGTLEHCTLSGNWAGWVGGGAIGCDLDNCILAENRAGIAGGGAYAAGLNNCTLAGNSSAQSGGGAEGGGLNNCIIYFNTAPVGANYDGLAKLEYCCTTPTPTNGFGNITNAPLLVDYTNGNLRLQPNSPCINSGNNSHLINSCFTNNFDIDGRPRVVSGTVDIGAYEYQGSGSCISYAWLQQYGLPSDGSADYADPDSDGMNNWQEWRCQTTPTNALSALRLLSLYREGTNLTLTWQSAAGVSYFLERSTNLAVTRAFTPLGTSIIGQTSTTTFVDTNTVPLTPLYYRVGVSTP